MTTLNVELSDEQMQLLREQAERASVPPEELVRISLEQWLSHKSESFEQAIEYVLEKNRELYQRLA